MHDGARRLSQLLLSYHYFYRPSEYLSWALEAVLRGMGCQIGEPAPEKARRVVDQVVECYLEEVAKAHPFTDLLGEAYMDTASKSRQSGLGQYFTPTPIARMMAKMLMGVESGRKPNGDLWRTCDPTSGSGVMMLTAAQEILDSHGKDALANWSFTCCDLDYVCSLMSAVQLLANCAVFDLTLGEVLVLHGDSLRPTLDGMSVIVHATAPAAPVVPALHPGRLQALQQAAEQNLFPWYQAANE